ncbi:MAG: hypothetical protein C0462_01715 [Alcanivorax sp.]|nr:hypothetical protein [Alcanivorax sp.]
MYSRRLSAALKKLSVRSNAVSSATLLSDASGVSVDLAWKTAKKSRGITTSAPKDVVREMAQSGYIDDVQLWLEAIDMRNLSSHAYKEHLAEKVYDFACAFLPRLQSLIARPESK